MVYQQFTFQERCGIARWKRRGLSDSEIARKLGRHRSSIGREIARNSDRHGRYCPVKAQQKVYFRKKKHTGLSLKKRRSWNLWPDRRLRLNTLDSGRKSRLSRLRRLFYAKLTKANVRFRSAGSEGYGRQNGDSSLSKPLAFRKNHLCCSEVLFGSPIITQGIPQELSSQPTHRKKTHKRPKSRLAVNRGRLFSGKNSPLLLTSRKQTSC